MVDLTPTDFLSGLGGLANLPRPYDAQQQVMADQQRTQGNDQALQLGAMKLSALQRQQQQEQQYQSDVANALKTNQFAGLYAKYPDQQKQLQAAHDALDEPAKRAQERDLYAVSSYIKNGAIDSAKTLLQKRIDADKAAGQDASDDMQMLDALSSGDPNQVKAAADMALYAVLPEDKRAQFFGQQDANHFTSTGDGAIYDQRTGSITRQAPEKTEYRSVGAGDTLFKLGGGDPASGGGPAAGRTQGGWTPRERNGGDNPDAAVDNKITGVAQLLGVDPNADISTLSPAQIARALAYGEGGKGSLADRNNNPTNLRNGDGTYKQFKSPDQAYTAAAALVARKLKNGQTTVRTLIEGLPVGGAPSGGAQIVAQGAPKPGYSIVPPAEVATIPGLDPQTVYQRSPDGQITAVGGQSKSQLKPWPNIALGQRTANIAALKNLEPAFAALNPASKDKGAKVAQNALGIGNNLPNRFVNWSDPEGTDFRARIGQIGGIIIKDTSGAAVSLSEDARLGKWVPQVTDSPATARAKLGNLIRELRQRNEALDETYTEDQGFRAFHASGAAASGPAVQVKTTADWSKLPKGTPYIDPKGVRRVKS